jgi:hypothetical protein
METRTQNRLDAQDVQIKQLHTDVTEIKTTLKALEIERAESSEFRKVVLELLKQKEKPSPVENPGSGGDSDDNSGVVFTKTGGSGAGARFSSMGDASTGLPWAVKKVKLPEFSGFDPQGWIQKANLYFDMLSHLS